MRNLENYEFKRIALMNTLPTVSPSIDQGSAARFENDLIVKLEDASSLLDSAKGILDMIKILNLAASAEFFARRQKLSEECIAKATEIKIYSMAKLGEMLQKTPRNEGTRKRKSGESVKGDRPTLSELGISKKLSAKAQKVAALPPEIVQALASGTMKLSEVINPKGEIEEAEIIASGSSCRIPPGNGLTNVEGETPIKRDEFLANLLEEIRTKRKEAQHVGRGEMCKSTAITLGPDEILDWIEHEITVQLFN
jgi:hypothetical protein